MDDNRVSLYIMIAFVLFNKFFWIVSQRFTMRNDISITGDSPKQKVFKTIHMYLFECVIDQLTFSFMANALIFVGYLIGLHEEILCPLLCDPI